MDKVYVKGQKLFITTEEATYDGTFHSMDAGRNRLTVKDVIKHPSEEAFEGLYHFYRSEVLNVQIMDPLASPWLTPGTEIVGNRNSSIMRGVQAPPAARVPFSRREPKSMPKDMHKYYLSLLKNLKTIDEVDDNFDLAVADIMSHSIVGVSCEGAMLGRRGKLSWIGVCCPDFNADEEEASQLTAGPSSLNLYLFDVALMGTVAFSKGLKTFFEDKHSPKKVIHDCRFFSDCLYHEFDVKLQNVLDTQVAESLVSFPRMRVAEEKGGSKLVFTRSLNSCLTHKLGLSPNMTYQPNINDGFIKKNIEIWFQRPITPLMAKALTFQSIYLIHLWNKLSQALPYPAFKAGVDIYLSCVRDADDDTAFLMTNYYHLMPEKFVPILLLHHNEMRRTRSRYGKWQNTKSVREDGRKKTDSVH
ncbi:piRNA biogenesis protein EXD1-like [Ischnura elegans]|uniref:piRNA biogenesis protein EXD1-like n=1 Tax=Ischnura elegans TaxID=197161 RepID=UPI001ED86851|nr:piRNA biogenesis protein EXD1-like [Ischnura elegans]